MSETRSLEAESDLNLTETHPLDSGVIYSETQLGVGWDYAENVSYTTLSRVGLSLESDSILSEAHSLD